MNSPRVSTLFSLALFLCALLLPTVALARSATGLAVQVARSGAGMTSAAATTVVGQNDPTKDSQTLANALAAAAPGDTLILEGIFDLGDCRGAFALTKNITITSPANPNLRPAAAAQLRNCGPAFQVQMPNAAGGELTIRNIWFRGQSQMSIELSHSVNPVNIVNNRFSENIPTNFNGAMIRHAVGAAGLGPLDIQNRITISGNTVDWSGSPHNDQFVGDDNGFAFAATNLDAIIRDNTIITLGEGIELEGNFGQDRTYLVEGNVVRTDVPPSPSGLASSSLGSVAEGLMGGHPAAVKLHANEGTYTVRDNDIALTGLPYGVCMMATTLNTQALAGEQVLLIENNDCALQGQLAGILGAWGQVAPFFQQASLSGAIVQTNRFSGRGAVGIAMINRVGNQAIGSVANDGHNNLFAFNDFANFAADRADIGFDQQTANNLVRAWPNDVTVDLGRNLVLDQVLLLPFAAGE